MEGDRNIGYNLYLVLVVFYFRICFITSCSVYENNEYERTYISRHFINLSINYESINELLLVHQIMYYFFIQTAKKEEE